MNIYLLNSTFEAVAVIDCFSSLIWTTRYSECGDFELYAPASAELLAAIQPNFYLRRDDSDRLMIVEKVKISTDAESGNYMTISGRSAESILMRRIVTEQTNIDGTAEGGIRQLVSENVTAPTDAARTISFVTLAAAAGLPATLKTQITWDNLYDSIAAICAAADYGFKMVFTGSQLTLSVFAGTDHSFGQSANPFVIFSPEYDNLINSEYEYSAENFKQYAYVAGEGEGTARQVVGISSGSGISGAARRELYVDAKDISSNDGEIPASQYMALLTTRGSEKLAEHMNTTAFEGTVEAGTSFTYKTDWDIGDIVQIENEYGFSAAPRIVEIIETFDENGYSVIPTLKY